MKLKREREMEQGMIATQGWRLLAISSFGALSCGH